MSELVVRNDRDGVAWLTINRPDKLNALNVPVFEELEAHIKTIARQTDAVGAIVLRGAGKCFSAGHDLGDIAVGEKLPRPNFQAHVIEALSNLPQPVITAVHSHCYTGALELALGGDILIASANAKFADTHAKWALTPVWGMSQRLPRRVGKHKALEMMFTARTYLADEAVAMGLANMVFPDDSFEADVTAFCAEILANSWFSLRANKTLVLSSDGMGLEEGLAHEIYTSQGVGPDMADRIGGFGKK